MSSNKVYLFICLFRFRPLLLELANLIWYKISLYFDITLETYNVCKHRSRAEEEWLHKILFVTLYKNCQVTTTDNLFRYLAQLFDLISRTNSFWYPQGQNKQRVFHGAFSLKSDKRCLSFFRLTPSVTLTSKESSLLSDVF